MGEVGFPLGLPLLLLSTRSLYTGREKNTRGLRHVFPFSGYVPFSFPQNHTRRACPLRSYGQAAGAAAVEQEFARREAPVGRRADGKPSFCPKAPVARRGKNAVMAPSVRRSGPRGEPGGKVPVARFRRAHGVSAVPTTQGPVRGLVCHPAIILFPFFRPK